ncbi:unnamed protein product [Linum tenue]|uniref:TIR domain-containing protein n=1 Tax=Linum tenue TaxID=586396 RepID=A0AAV0KKC9_9ROSI|nr:unnamed protein product [Linum tenue]
MAWTYLDTPDKTRKNISYLTYVYNSSSPSLSNNARPAVGDGHPPPPSPPSKPPRELITTNNINVPSPPTKYDAFISFRGEDIRDQFLSHLFRHLNEVKKLETFKDDTKIKGGDEISPTLSRAIEGSAVYVVVLSPNYATSKWCLEELVKITECRRQYGRKVIPVFYGGVDPSSVRNQGGSFGVAFSQQEKVLPKEMMGRVERWKAALREVANLSGFDSRVIKNEDLLVKKIAESVMAAIIPTLHPLSPPQKGLVGIDHQLSKLEHLSRFDDLQHNLTIGLWGMGGIGKTTLARAIFDLHSSQFEAFYFLQEFTGQLKKSPSQLAEIQDKLFSTLLGDTNSGAIPSELKLRRLRRLRVLVVVDDVARSSMRALEELLEGSYCELFGEGSRVLLTSEDQQVLNTVSDKVYEVEALGEEKSLRLFSLCAFKEDRPPDEYLDRCMRVVSYANGNPLALKVLGPIFLNKPMEYWDGVLGRLGAGSGNKEILDILKISYDGLEKEEQRVFLDIACLCNHESWKSLWKKVLDEDIVTNLVDKSLLRISDDSSSGLIEMPGLLEDLGKSIVRKQEGKLNERSRLWDADEAATLFNENMGTCATEGIFLDLGETKEEVSMAADAFERMRNLRLLRIREEEAEEPCVDPYRFYLFHNPDRKVGLHWWWGLNSLPNKLKYLDWDLFPATSLPRKFSARHLVILRLKHSNIQQLWQGVNVDVGNLKELDLYDSKYLKTLPDLSTAKKLESVDLSNCVRLVELHPSILLLPKLKSLDLRNCRKVRFGNLDYYYNTNIQASGGRRRRISRSRSKNTVATLPSLEELNLERTPIKQVPEFIRRGGAPLLSALNCTACPLSEFPVVAGVKQLTLNVTYIERLPTESSEVIIQLEVLVFRYNPYFSHLSDSFTKWKSLKILDLHDCRELREFPEILEPVESLSQLYLAGCTNISRLPDSICNLVGLERLHLSRTGVRQLPASIGDLNRLSVLSLYECESLVSLPDTFSKLPALVALDITSCHQLSDLRSDQLPKSLKYVSAVECKPEIQEIVKLNVPEDPDADPHYVIPDLYAMLGDYS